jgi:hypothetical protein
MDLQFNMDTRPQRRGLSRRALGTAACMTLGVAWRVGNRARRLCIGVLTGSAKVGIAAGALAFFPSAAKLAVSSSSSQSNGPFPVLSYKRPPRRECYQF